MATKNWKVDVDGAAHDVELRWSYWGGSREVLVDGRTVAKSKSYLAWDTSQEFEIDGHPAEVRTKPTRKVSVTFAITLTVDGKEIAPAGGS